MKTMFIIRTPHSAFRILLAAFCLLPSAFCFAQGGQATALRRDPLTMTRLARGFPGANAGAQIAAAIADLPATGGTVDARGFEGPQTISSTIEITADNVRLVLGAATYTFTGTGSAIYLHGCRACGVIGQGREATTLIANATGTQKDTLLTLKNTINAYAIGLTLDANWNTTSSLSTELDVGSWLDDLRLVHDTVVLIADSPAGAVRSSNVVTITTTTAHHLAVGASAQVCGVADATFNSDCSTLTGFTVASTPTSIRFTYAQAGADGSSGSSGAQKATVTSMSHNYGWHNRGGSATSWGSIEVSGGAMDAVFFDAGLGAIERLRGGRLYVHDSPLNGIDITGTESHAVDASDFGFILTEANGARNGGLQDEHGVNMKGNVAGNRAEISAYLNRMSGVKLEGPDGLGASRNKLGVHAGSNGIGRSGGHGLHLNGLPGSAAPVDGNVFAGSILSGGTDPTNRAISAVATGCDFSAVNTSTSPNDIACSGTGPTGAIIAGTQGGRNIQTATDLPYAALLGFCNLNNLATCPDFYWRISGLPGTAPNPLVLEIDGIGPALAATRTTNAIGIGLELEADITERLAVMGNVALRQIAAVAAAVFTGTGLDDLTSGGVYNGATNSTYTVEIDAEGAPDTFRWRKGAGAWTAAVPITGAAQTLAEGVTIAFLATTGHTLTDSWAIAVTAAYSGALTKPVLTGTRTWTFPDAGGTVALGDLSGYLPLAGGTVTGPLQITRNSADPFTSLLGMTNKQSNAAEPDYYFRIPGAAANSPMILEVNGVGDAMTWTRTREVGIGIADPALIDEKVVVAGNVKSTRLISTQATGTPPLTVASVTEVSNLRAATASGLAANGANCSTGEAPLGVDAAGAAESCWAVAPASHPHAGTDITSGTVADTYLPTTLGTKVIVGSFYQQTHGTCCAAQVARYTESVTTTDATVTTIATISPPIWTSLWARATVTARRTDYTGRAAYQRFGAFYRDAGNTVQVQSTVDQGTAELDPAWDVTMVVSGTVVQVRVTGAAATTIVWTATIEYQFSGG